MRVVISGVSVLSAVVLVGIGTVRCMCCSICVLHVIIIFSLKKRVFKMFLCELLCSYLHDNCTGTNYTGCLSNKIDYISFPIAVCTMCCAIFTFLSAGYFNTSYTQSTFKVLIFRWAKLSLLRLIGIRIIIICLLSVLLGMFLGHQADHHQHTSRSIITCIIICVA